MGARFMKLSRYFFITFTICSGSSATELLFVEADRHLTIRVYDYAGTKPGLMKHAREQTAEILERAGVYARWEQCPISEEAPKLDNTCTQEAAVHVLQLRIHPREMSTKASKRRVELGYALPLSKGFGVICGVYVDRTFDLAESLGLQPHVVLGHAIAHEIGHLLLGHNSHARDGIMIAKWGDGEIRLAKSGRLEFSDAQARRMQADVARRLALVR